MVDYEDAGQVGNLSSMTGITYRCDRCGREFDGKELVDRTEVKCIECGFRVIQKVKPPIARRIKAI